MDRMENKFKLTSLEIVFNRLFAIVLVLATVPLLLNILNIPTMVLFTLFSIFLFSSKKYHPFVNTIFLILASGVYFLPLPIDWGLFLGLREFRFNGYVFNPIIIYFYLSPFLFVSLSIRNILGNILSCFNLKTSVRHILLGNV